MRIEVGEYLQLKDCLDVGVTKIPQDTPFLVKNISNNMVGLLNDMIGLGCFSKEEVEKYFKESSEEYYVAWVEQLQENLNNMYLDYVDEDDEE